MAITAEQIQVMLELKDQLSAQLGEPIDKIQDVGKAAKDTAPDIRELGDTFTTAAADIKSSAASMQAAASTVGESWDGLEKSLGEVTNELKDLNDTLEEGRGKWDDVGEGAGSAEQFLNGLNDQLSVAGDLFGLNTGAMTQYIGAAAQVSGGLEGIIKGAGGFVTAMGPMLTQIPTVVTATWGHVAALTAQAAAFIVANAPMLLIIASIALLAAGVVLLIKNWDDIEPHIRPVTDFFKNTVVPAANAVWQDGLKPVIDFVQNNWQIITALILAPFAPLILVATDAFGIRSKTEGAIQAIVDKIEDAAGWIGHWLNVAGGYFQDFYNLATWPIQQLMGLIDSLISKIRSIPSPGDVVGGITGKLGGINIPGFAEGGLVPGPLGAPILAIVHGGETVIPVGGKKSGGEGSTVTLQINIENFHGTQAEARDTAYVIHNALRARGLA